MFGTGYGTSPTAEDYGSELEELVSSEQSNREHGSSYMTIAEWVGLLGVLPFIALLVVTVSNVWKVCAWMNRTSNPRHYSIPLAMVVLAGLVHATFEDWLFAVGYYICVYFWILAFLLADLVPDAVAVPAPSVVPRTSHAESASFWCARAQPMIRLFINGLAASAGGGLTYLRNVIPQLSQRGGTQTTVLLSPAMRAEFGELPNIALIEDWAPSGAARRFIREQTMLPKLIRRSGAQVLISAGNFALWRSPVPQILLSRNSLYTSSDFSRDVRARGDYAILADTLFKGWLARQSIRRADVAVAPSAAFAQELSEWSGRKVLAVHHGFDPDGFTSDATPLPAAVQSQLEQAKDAFRLLFVSHYNYYRNFETLFRAMPILGDRFRERK